MTSVLCFGDSNTYGYTPGSGKRYPKDVRWTGVLSSLLGNEYSVIEEGLNGRTTIFTPEDEPWKNGLNYFVPCLASHRPDVLIIMLGTNDCNSIYDTDIEDMDRGIRKILEAEDFICNFKEFPKPRTLLISPCPIHPVYYKNSPFVENLKEKGVKNSIMMKDIQKKAAEDFSVDFMFAGDFIEASPIDSEHLSPENHNKLAHAVFNKLKEMGI